ncbi:MAG: 23S rRNA (uracil(1939)-C(5))-methyltransferase RlmD, partial [Microcoleaceae cyanobacterium]
MTKSKNILSIDIDPNWQQGQLIEITIDDLGDTGDGVGRYQDRVIFVPDTVPGDRIVVRLVRVKREYAQGKLQEILTPSPQRVRPSCIVADKCGGCQWQHIDYAYQLKAKENQVMQALERIGKIKNPPVLPILSVGAGLDYRNKATYPFGRSQQGQLQAGYYQKGTHKLVNLNQCPVQDKRLNVLLQEVKQDLQREGWSIYDEKTKQGVLRHLSLRI